MVPLFPAPGWAAQQEDEEKDEEEDEEASAQRLLKGLAWTA